MRSLVALIGDIYGGSIDYGWDVEPVEAPPETAIPFGLLVQEALTNALKYGATEGGGIRISLFLHRREGGEVELRVSDEGPGFPRDRPEKGLGMELMKALAAQLDGRLGFSSAPGAVVSLCFTPRPPQSSPEAAQAGPGPSAATT